MPTQSTTYNSRVTDESLEKRFRDTFRSQGGAELVDDLYAQGVIVPVVDFTAAAIGSQLETNLQTAWDFTTGSNQVVNTTTNIITNSGFWQVNLNCTLTDIDSTSVNVTGRVFIDDGSSTKDIWGVSRGQNTLGNGTVATSGSFVCFLRAGDTLKATTNTVNNVIDIWYRQIATVNGDLVNPSGFTSS